MEPITSLRIEHEVKGYCYWNPVRSQRFLCGLCRQKKRKPCKLRFCKEPTTSLRTAYVVKAYCYWSPVNCGSVRSQPRLCGLRRQGKRIVSGTLNIVNLNLNLSLKIPTRRLTTHAIRKFVLLKLTKFFHIDAERACYRATMKSLIPRLDLDKTCIRNRML